MLLRTVRAVSRPNTHVLVLCGGVLATSWAAIFVRLADEAEPLSIAAYRMLFGAAATLIVALALSRGRVALPGTKALLLLLLAGGFLALHFWTWFASLERTSVGSSVVIVAAQPLLGALLGYAAFRERPARAEWLGIGIASTGLLIIAGVDAADGSPDLAGNALALLGGIFGAAYRTVGRGMRRSMGATGYSAAVYAVAALLLWAAVVVERPAVSGFGGETWTFLLLLGLVPQLIGHTAFNWALGRLRVVTVGIAALGEPVFATLIAIPVLSEAPGIGVVLGGPLIIAGVVVALRGVARERGYQSTPGEAHNAAHNREEILR